MGDLMEKVVNRILLILFACMTATNVFAYDWEVQIEGAPIQFERDPIIIEGVTMVPLAEFYQALGLAIEFDKDSMFVSGDRGGLEIKTKVDSNLAYINGNPHLMPYKPVIIKNRTMVPLRFVAENYGYQVVYVPEIRVVYLRQFIFPVSDIIEANEQAARFNKETEIDKPDLEFVKPEGWKDEFIFTKSEIDFDKEEEIEGAKRIYQDENAYLSLAVKNSGDAEFDGESLLEIRKGLKAFRNIKIPKIKSGEVYFVENLNLGNLDRGSNTFEFFLNPGNENIEENEENNYEYIILNIVGVN